VLQGAESHHMKASVTLRISLVYGGAVAVTIDAYQCAKFSV
jgi:hypothetical protein